MIVNNFSGPNSHVSPLGHYVDSPHTSPTIKRNGARGQEAAVEMTNRLGLIDKVDKLMFEELNDQAKLEAFFSEKIKAIKSKITSTSPKELDVISHAMFAIYRRELVEKACKTIDENPLEWGFNKSEWAQKRVSFKDFMWIYSKMLGSDDPAEAIAKTLKQELSNIPSNYRPPLHIKAASPEEANYFPNS